MTKRLLAASILGTLSTVLFHAPASGASFDCSRATSPDEIAVCASPQLSALDSEMGGLWYAYSRVPMFMGSNGNRADEAQAFLASRHACGRNGGCLAQAYNGRIATLRREIDSAMAQLARLQNGK